MEEYKQYENGVKPEGAPPEGLFGVVGTGLYVIIAISFAGVFGKVFIKKELPKKVALPFALNLFFNLIFTPIQFGLENLTLALLDILLVWGTIIGMIGIIKPYNKYIAGAQIPYLTGVSIATVLQFSIFGLN